MLSLEMSLLSLSRLALFVALLALATGFCLTEKNSPTVQRQANFRGSTAPYQKKYPSTLGGASYKELQSAAAQQVAAANVAASGAQPRRQGVYNGDSALDRQNAVFKNKDKKPEIRISNLQQTSSLADDLENISNNKQEPSGSEGLVPSGGGIYNINNHVSNIKMGNSKRQDYNLVNQVVQSPAFLNSRNFVSPTTRVGGVPTGKRLSNPMQGAGNLNFGSQDIFGPAFVNQFAPRRQTKPTETDYEKNYFGDNDDYDQLFGYQGADQANSYLDDDAFNAPHQCTDNCNHGSARGKVINTKVAPVKQAKSKKTKASAEQLELKEKLLNLASKATENALDDGDEVPLLKFNKQTGKYEAVQVDPSANAYKEKLRAALEALSAKKLPTKKLKKVLSDLDDSETGPSSELDTSPGFNDVPSSRVDPGADGVRSSRSGAGAQGVGIDDIPVRNLRSQPDQQQRAAQYQDRYSDSELGYPNGKSSVSDGSYLRRPNEQVDDESSQRSNLVQLVRAILKENLQKVADATYFSPEFLNQLLAVDDEELTPVEADFKRFILCREDEQFCTNQPRDGTYQQDEELDSSPQQEAYDEVYEPQQQQQQQYEEYPEQSDPLQYEQYNELDELNEPNEQVNPEREQELANEDDQHYSRQLSEQSYVFKHSTGGARNGIPLNPQSAHFAHQSSFSRVNQRPQPTQANPNRVQTSAKPAPKYQPGVQQQPKQQLKSQPQLDLAKQQRLPVQPSGAPLNNSTPKAQAFKAPPPAAPVAVAPKYSGLASEASKSQPQPQLQQQALRRGSQSPNLQQKVTAPVGQPQAALSRSQVRDPRRISSVENKQFV